jgi:hypothetical protein
MANQRMIVTIDFIPLPFILANLLKKKKNEKKESSSILLLLSCTPENGRCCVDTGERSSYHDLKSPKQHEDDIQIHCSFSILFLSFFLSHLETKHTHDIHRQILFGEKRIHLETVWP